MSNGLDIGLVEFKKMKAIDRDVLIYNNTVQIRKNLGDYKFHRKVHYVWLICLTTFIGLKRFLGI